MKRTPSTEHVFAHGKLIKSAQNEVDRHRHLVENSGESGWASALYKSDLHTFENLLLSLQAEHITMVHRCLYE